MTTLNLQVGAITQDFGLYWQGYVWNGGINFLNANAGYVNSTEFKEGVGMQFSNVAIPQGAIISVAYLTMTCRVGLSATIVNSYITGEDADDTVAFSDNLDYKARRGTVVGGPNNDRITSAQVAWDNIPAWTADVAYNSPSIISIIQEIVNRAGWVSGNNMVLFWDDHDNRSTQSANTARCAHTYNSSSVKAPKLHIEYFVLTQKTISDILGIATAASAVHTGSGAGVYSRILSESLALIDNITASATQIYAKSISETVSVVDSITKAIDIKRTVAEVISLVEGISIWGSAVQMFSDIVTTGEAMAKTVRKTVTDNLAMADSAARSLQKGIANTISVVSDIGLYYMAYIPGLVKLYIIDSLSIVASSIQDYLNRWEIDLQLSTEPYLDMTLSIEGGGNK